ncbi:integrase core domain-containing protein, partial [Streptomyces brasiliscabiei]|uniref:integrase core domain-containing protein n=1 Tax=Streptomyces brasiliscabiei TaxID=2736302 RepID=UPI0038F7D8A7
RKATPLMLHSDRGTQYTSREFRQALDDNHICSSYSRPGYPYDNSVTESFFKYLKQDCINRKKFSTIDEVSLACFEYIEGYYN